MRFTIDVNVTSLPGSEDFFGPEMIGPELYDIVGELLPNSFTIKESDSIDPVATFSHYTLELVGVSQPR